MDDTISRGETIESLERAKQNIRHNIERAIGEAICEILDEVESGIKQLPPAELSTNLAEVGTDCISRKQAIDALRTMQTYKLFAGDDMLLIDQAGAQTELMLLPPAQPEIIRCKDCKYWNSGSCECREHTVNCQDYYVGDMETEAEHFCGYAERREVTT